MQPTERARRLLACERQQAISARGALVFGCGISAGWLAPIADVRAQTVAQPVTRQEVAQQEIAGELDLWAQYRPSDGSLKGSRVKLQSSDLGSRATSGLLNPS